MCIIFFNSYDILSGKWMKNSNTNDSKSVGSVLTSRKSSSTPSIPDATENQPKSSVASTDQASSADNLAAKVRFKCDICITTF